MSLDQCTFSLDTAGGCLQTSFSDTDQLPLLNGMLTPAKSCENEPPMDGFPACECMKGTLACLIHPSTPEAWTLLMRDSLARTLALLESRQAYLREPDQVFTVKSCASLAWYDQSSCSWKTYQRSLVTDWEPFSETWPRWGMTAGGAAYAHPMSERRMGGIDGGCVPNNQDFYHTPNTTGMDGVSNSRKALKKRLENWPTPNASDNRDRGNASTPAIARRIAKGKQVMLSMMVSQENGRLNPNWVAWLMGWPLAWCQIKHFKAGGKKNPKLEGQPT